MNELFLKIVVALLVLSWIFIEIKRKISQKPKTSYKEKVKKGKIYEKFISKYYKSLGYKVVEHGKIMGKKDQGIDIIAQKRDETVLIQCKNFHPNTLWKIKQKDIKAFRMDCLDFIAENPHYKSKSIKALFILSNDVIDYGAKAYIKEKKAKGKKIDYEIIPYKK